MWTRRGFVMSAALLPLCPVAWAASDPEAEIAAIEKRAGGRLGVAAFDSGTKRRIGYREDERFAMCSTFKLLVAGAVLHRVDRGDENLDRWIRYGKVDLLEYAPIARANLEKGGLTVSRMAQAAVEDSDNTCANLLLKSLGGPAGFTAYTRALGDPVTRLDRPEPELNTAVAGDPRDTTSPSAMLEDLRRLTVGVALSKVSRERLTSWLAGCHTATRRIPAGLPAGWKSGNKTGTGDNGSTNDVAIIWPPGRAPIFLSVYFTGSTIKPAAREAVIADVARSVSKAFA